MAKINKLTGIEDQKQLIQAQSEVFRRSIQLEWETLKLDTAWVGRGVDWINRYRNLLLLLAAPVGGLLVVRRGRGIRRLLLQGFTAWQMVRRIGAVTSLFRRR
jgi:hypothetical protein